MEEEFKVVIDIPKKQKKVYPITAEYPGAAIAKAMGMYKDWPAGMSPAEKRVFMHCFRAHPKSAGGRYKEPTLIEELYKKVYGGEDR